MFGLKVGADGTTPEGTTWMSPGRASKRNDRLRGQQVRRHMSRLRETDFMEEKCLHSTVRYLGKRATHLKKKGSDYQGGR